MEFAVQAGVVSETVRPLIVEFQLSPLPQPPNHML